MTLGDDTIATVSDGNMGRGSRTLPRPVGRLRTRGRWRLAPYLLALPAVAIVGLLAVCLVALFIQSLQGKQGPGISLDQYRLLAEDPTYRGYLLISIRIAFAATIGCLLVGYPVAYYMSTARPALRQAITMFLVLLFFSDYVMRVYSLILLIGNNGLFNRTLIYLGLIHSPVRLLYSETGVVIGLVLGNVPFMIFAIVTVLSRLDARLPQAAALLGATPWAVWRRIVLPLSAPGIVSGAIIVFLLSMNAYLTPALLGGGFVQMVANLVYDQAINLWNMPLAAAAAVIVLIFAFAVIGLVNAGFERFGRRVGIVGGHR
jgi:ABC-type spermidine/putrescine transport system permease subunit I